MNTDNEEKWDGTDVPKGLNRMQELEDLATGFLIGLITAGLLYLIVFYMCFSIHSYVVARQGCKLVGHVAQEDGRTFEGRYYLNVYRIFCK